MDSGLKFPEYMGLTDRRLIDERYCILARLSTTPDAEARIAFINAELAVKPPSPGMAFGTQRR